jgi:putative lipoic acid-binding regulatory protein
MDDSERLLFPLDMQFRIIAENRNGMHFIIETVLMQEGITSALRNENKSEGGKYLSFSVDVRIESREMMTRIDSALRNILGVKMVL